MEKEKNERLAVLLLASGKGERLAKKLGGIGYTGSNLNPQDIKKFIITIQFLFLMVQISKLIKI